jgi:hypothetical protein
MDSKESNQDVIENKDEGDEEDELSKIKVDETNKTVKQEKV